jgi:hypothetical protein
VLKALRDDERSALCLWADRDPMLTLETGRLVAAACGCPTRG